MARCIDGSKLNKVKWAALLRNINHPSFYRGQKRRLPSDYVVLIGVNQLNAFTAGFLNILIDVVLNPKRSHFFLPFVDESESLMVVMIV